MFEAAAVARKNRGLSSRKELKKKAGRENGRSKSDQSLAVGGAVPRSAIVRGRSIDPSGVFSFTLKRAVMKTKPQRIRAWSAAGALVLALPLGCNSGPKTPSGEEDDSSEGSSDAESSSDVSQSSADDDDEATQSDESDSQLTDSQDTDDGSSDASQSSSADEDSDSESTADDDSDAESSDASDSDGDDDDDDDDDSGGDDDDDDSGEESSDQSGDESEEESSDETDDACDSFASIVSKETFDTIFPLSLRNPAYTYEGMVEATESYPQFATTGDCDQRKREVAAIFANITREVGCLQYIEQIDTSTGPYCDESRPYGCPAGAENYFGRGPIQLSWNYNYYAAGNALGLDLLNKPELVAEDSKVSWQTALWFWNEGGGGDTPHSAITSGQGFGATINLINGWEECNGGNVGYAREAVTVRVCAYQAYTALLGTDVGPGDLNCGTQLNPCPPGCLDQ
jgi:hypothetical protein